MLSHTFPKKFTKRKASKMTNDEILDELDLVYNLVPVEGKEMEAIGKLEKIAGELILRKKTRDLQG